MQNFQKILSEFNEFLWGYLDFYLIIGIGLYFTVKSRGFQFRALIHPLQTFKSLIDVSSQPCKGVTPWKLYFSSIGGAIGIGNIGGIVAAVSVGGPGGLFWMWVSVIVGGLVKYSEVFLGIVHRKANNTNSYDGGAMFYLRRAFKSKIFATFFCVLMCIYGTEIYQFKVIEDAIVETFHFNRWIVLALLLSSTFYVTLGGVNRLAKICSLLMPVFLIVYAGVCLFVILKNAALLPEIFKTVFKSAFTGHAAVGGFAGSTLSSAVQQGLSNAVYSGDIGMGYDSVIQSETQLTKPYAQARASIFTLFTDCLVCTLSVLLVLVTNQWCSGKTHGFDCVVAALGTSFPYVPQLMAFFFFLAGWTTILGYLAVSVKSAKALAPNGPKFYLIYALLSFIIFSFVDQNAAREVMFTAGGLIILINLAGIFRLREGISFSP